jgi:hypothetical protein
MGENIRRSVGFEGADHSIGFGINTTRQTHRAGVWRKGKGGFKAGYRFFQIICGSNGWS